jgi:hypothetical protein
VDFSTLKMEAMFPRNVGSLKIYMAPHPRRWHSSLTLSFTDFPKDVLGYNTIKTSLEKLANPLKQIATSHSLRNHAADQSV